MAIALPVENGVANLAFVIEESTMLLALIAVTPIFDPVTAPSTILFALIAVRPSFGPVTAPLAISAAITVPSAMESAVTLFNGILYSLTGGGPSGLGNFSFTSLIALNHCEFCNS